MEKNDCISDLVLLLDDEKKKWMYLMAQIPSVAWISFF